jgi:LuxR family transcriptional regulator, maltose regulon positive regulatory protein
VGSSDGSIADRLEVGDPMFEAHTTSDVLLASKLRVPRPRPGWVPRPRLLRHLRAGTARELVLVCGPAGFGKSSLLADWVGNAGRAVAWLSLDEGDNDPVRFWRHVTAALDGVLPGVAERAGALVGGGASTSIRAVVTALVNDLVETPGEALLVVDDYHLIQAPEVHSSLAFLLDQLPGSLRIVLASRSDPPLPLARLRARGQLAEIRATDLRFTRGEAGELLRAALGPDLPDRIVAALEERTEGWVAGLQLAALSLHGHADVARFVEEFSGSHRFVLDYLTEEVLDRQSERLRTFLLETSVLDRLSGPLCDALTGGTDGQELLEAAERANLFLLALDEERNWWRYHHLFAEVLRARLLQRHPAEVVRLHRAAAEWHERHGLADDAVRHAVACGDPTWAATLIEGHLEDQVLLLGQGATLIRWLSVLPPDVIHRRPRLTLGQAVVALLEGRLDDVEPLPALAERTFAQAGDTPYHASIDRRDSIVANVPAAVAVGRADLACLRGDAERGAAYGRAASGHLTDQDELLRVIVSYHLGVADWLAGRLGQAEQAFAEVVSQRSRPGSATWSCAPAMTSVACSRRRDGWARRCAPTSACLRRPWAAGRRRRSAWRTSAWPRCCTSATNSARPANTRRSGSSSAVGSPTPHRWWTVC